MEVSKFRAEETQSSSHSGSGPAISAHLRVRVCVTASVYLQAGAGLCLPGLQAALCCTHPSAAGEIQDKEAHRQLLLGTIDHTTGVALPLSRTAAIRSGVNSFLFSSRNYGQSCFLVRKFYSSSNDQNKRTSSTDRICLVHGPWVIMMQYQLGFPAYKKITELPMLFSSYSLRSNN